MENNINTKSFLDFHGLQTFWNKLKATFADKRTVDSSLNSINTEIVGIKTNISGLNYEISNIKQNINEISPKEAINYSHALSLALSSRPATIIEVKGDETINGIDYFSGFYIVGSNGTLKYLGVSSGADVTNELAEINAAIKNIVNDIDSLNYDFNTLNSKLNSLENNSATKSDINNLQSAIDSLFNDVNTVKSNISNLESDLTNAVKSLEKTITEVNTNISSLDNEVQDVKISVNNLELKVDKNSSDIISLENTLESVNDEFITIDNNIETLTSSVNTINTDIVDINKEIEDINSALKNIPTDGVIDELRSNVETLNTTVNNTVSTVESLQIEVSTNTNLVNELGSSVKSTTDKVNSNTQRIDALNGNIQNLSTKDEVKSEVNNIKNEIIINKEEILNEVSDTYISIENAGDHLVDISKEMVETIVVESNIIRASDDDISHIFITTYADTEDELRTQVSNGGKIKLTGDIVVKSGIEVTTTTIIDLNGHTLTSDVWDEDGESNSYVFWVKSGTLIINGAGIVSSSDAYYSMAVWANGGNVEINNGVFKNAGDACDLIYVSKAGNVVINGGKFIPGGPAAGKEPGTKNPYSAINIKDSNRDTCSVSVRGGKFFKFNPADNVSETPHTNFVAEGYESVADGDWFEVVKSL